MITLGAFTLQSNPRQRTNQYYGLICLFLWLWIVTNYLADNNPNNALLWTRLAFTSSTLALAALVLFANVFPVTTVRSKLFAPFIGAFSGFIAVLTLTPQFVPAVTFDDQVANVITGPLYTLFIPYFFIMLVVAFWLLIRSERNTRGSNRERIRFVFTGVLLMVAGSSLTNLLLPLVTGNNPWAQYGPYFSIIFIGFTAYAIVRHRLFNVRAVVARSVVYVLVIVALAGIYAASLFTLSLFILPDARGEVIQEWLYVGLAVVLAITFQPLKSLFEQITDRVFFRDHYDSQTVLNGFGRVLVAEVKLENLSHRALQYICDELKITHGHLYVLNGGAIYHVAHYGSMPHRLPALPRLHSLRHRLAISDELEEGKERDLLEQFDMRLSLHLRTKHEMAGYLLLGDKMSGDIYVSQDIDVIEIMGQELAVAISNAKAYDQIAHFNATLQQKVDDATAQLKEANLHLKDLDKAKDEFISIASHQLRTPLTSIKGYLSMILDGDAGRVTKQQEEFIGYAYGGAQRMVHLISDLLNVSRMSAGRFKLERSSVSLVDLVADEVQQLQNHAAAKKLALIFKRPTKKIPMVFIDENKTRQVVMNFIDNAIYYTKEGSVTVTVERDGDSVVLKVIDTGIGVPLEAQQSLFTKFYRADNAQQVRPDGTGLGLYLAKKVVEDQNGIIIFESSEGKGSTFGFSLPLNKK